CGAELVYFSPLYGGKLPEDVDGLDRGGGVPEQFSEELSKQKETIQSIYNGITDEMRTLAEGGGLMYISESITDPDGQKHEMVGIVPGSAQMESKLVALGYRSVTGKENNFLLHTGKTVRGHVFHYSS